MGRTLPQMILFGSLLSLPAAAEKGTLALTTLYLAFTFFGVLLLVIVRMKQSGHGWTHGEFLFIALIPVVVAVNFFVSRFEGIPIFTWAARTVHVPMILLYFLLFRYAVLSVRDILNTMFVLGLIEVLMIFWVFFFGGGMAPGRATDIDGIIIYSVMLVISGYVCLVRYRETGQWIFLWLYYTVLFASVLTGTRGLIISVALLIVLLPLKWTKLSVIIASILGIYYALVNGYLGRFDIRDQDNVITILSKLNELEVLWSFFTSSPIWGVGFGHEYQVSFANSPYTYTHNAFLFYLGYGGLIAIPLFLVPLFQLIRAVPKGFVLAGAIMIFYTTSTSFTNVKHSIAMAAFVYIAGRTVAIGKRTQRRPSAIQVGGSLVAARKPRF